MFPRLAFQKRVEPMAYLLAPFRRHPKHRGDDLHRKQRREVLDHVERHHIELLRRPFDHAPNHGFELRIARGVNTLFTSARIRVCCGGSMMMITPSGVNSSGSTKSSRVTPFAEEYVS